MSHRRSKHESGSQEVEHAVLAYLHRHPDAADTLEGIVSWWLPQQRYETERERIERVLGGLVEQGALRCSRLPDGAVLYALSHSHKSHLH